MMDLIDNELLQNVPIEYKRIDVSYFHHEVYNVQEKIDLDVSEDGYISSSLTHHLENDIDNSNTTVINAGVGQGKSRTILSMVHRFVNEGYKVLIAVPFNNLIQQYKKDCEEFISSEKIFNIHSLKEASDENDNDESKELDHLLKGFGDYDVHLLTVNALLGNPGENSPFQSRKRLDYFNQLKEICELENQKMVIIFDEIHDAIQNFKAEFIYRLWNFQGLVHKIYTISATYNEASVEVVKYLSELTNRNILILESERKRIPAKQSDLYLNIYSSLKIENDINLKNILFDLVVHNKPFDIMVYSKGVIKKMLSEPLTKHSLENIELNIADEGIGVNHILHHCYSNINRCYSDIFDPTNANKRYDKNKINIGTNFTTGVNIEKENHTYILLFPKDVNIDFFNNKGVFSNGATSITQALARQRKKGDIHIFIPMPAMIDKESLPYGKLLNNKAIRVFKELHNPLKNIIKYTNVNSESSTLDTIYNELYEQVIEARNKITSTDREGTNRLLYPSKEIFILDKSEKILNNSFFGGDLSSYILWASLFNQFVNCDLKTLNYIKKLHFEEDEDKMFNKIKEIFQENKNLILEANQSTDGFELHPLKLFEEVNKFYTGYEEIFVGSKKARRITTNKMYLYNLSLTMDLNIIPKTTKNKKAIYHHYLKSSIYYSSIHSSDLSISNYLVVYRNDNYRVKVNLYKKLYQLVECIEQSKRLNKKGEAIVSINPNETFIKIFNELHIENVLNDLCREDFLLANIFSFKQTIYKAKTSTKKCNFIYKLLISSVFEAVRGNTTEENRKGIYITQKKCS